MLPMKRSREVAVERVPSNETLFLPTDLFVEKPRPLDRWSFEEIQRYFIRMVNEIFDNDTSQQLLEWLRQLRMEQPRMFRLMTITSLDRPALINLFIALAKDLIAFVDRKEGDLDLFFQFWEGHAADKKGLLIEVSAENNDLRYNTTIMMRFSVVLEYLYETVEVNEPDSPIYERCGMVMSRFELMVKNSHIPLDLNELLSFREYENKINQTRPYLFLKPFFNWVESQAWIQQRDFELSRLYVQDLNPSQRNILYLYTMGSGPFNDDTKTNPVHELDRAMLEQIFVNAPRLTKPLKVWRGVGLNRIKKLTSRRDIFVSTSIDIDQALGFVSGGCCLLQITCPAGFPLLFLDEVSFFGEEREMLGPKPQHLVNSGVRYRLQYKIGNEQSFVNVFEYTALWDPDLLSAERLQDQVAKAREEAIKYTSTWSFRETVDSAANKKFLLKNMVAAVENVPSKIAFRPFADRFYDYLFHLTLASYARLYGYDPEMVNQHTDERLIRMMRMSFSLYLDRLSSSEAETFLMEHKLTNWTSDVYQVVVKHLSQEDWMNRLTSA